MEFISLNIYMQFKDEEYSKTSMVVAAECQTYSIAFSPCTVGAKKGKIKIQYCLRESSGFQIRKSISRFTANFNRFNSLINLEREYLQFKLADTFVWIW